MIRRPPGFTLSDPLFPSTTLLRSGGGRVEVELERLRLDQLRRGRQHGDRGGGDGGLAARIEPAQLVGVPAIRSLEGQGAADAELGAAVRARDREQQAR